MRLRPSEVLFTQDSIRDRFQSNMFLTKTLEELLYRSITPDDIPPIEVIRRHGSWWALTGNRRLYLYRKLQVLGVVQTIPVVERLETEPGVLNQLRRRMTTVTNGETITCRQRTADITMNIIIDKWKMQRNNLNVSEQDLVDSMLNHFVTETPRAEFQKSRHLQHRPTGVKPNISDSENSFDRLGHPKTRLEVKPEIRSKTVHKDPSIRSSNDRTATPANVPTYTFPYYTYMGESFSPHGCYTSRQVSPQSADHIMRQHPQIRTNESIKRTAALAKANTTFSYYSSMDALFDPYGSYTSRQASPPLAYTLPFNDIMKQQPQRTTNEQRNRTSAPAKVPSTFSDNSYLATSIAANEGYTSQHRSLQSAYPATLLSDRMIRQQPKIRNNENSKRAAAPAKVPTTRVDLRARWFPAARPPTPYPE